MRRLTDMVHGHYQFKDGTFIPDEAMTEINARLRRLRLLADIGNGVPSFYLDPADDTYWQCTESEDYSKELRQVDRLYITQNFPTVDPDRPIA